MLGALHPLPSYFLKESGSRVQCCSFDFCVEFDAWPAEQLKRCKFKAFWHASFGFGGHRSGYHALHCSGPFMAV